MSVSYKIHSNGVWHITAIAFPTQEVQVQTLLISLWYRMIGVTFDLPIAKGNVAERSMAISFSNTLEVITNKELERPLFTINTLILEEFSKLLIVNQVLSELFLIHQSKYITFVGVWVVIEFGRVHDVHTNGDTCPLL